MLVFANPWTGETAQGEHRDGIAEFILAINRAPSIGEEPDWSRMMGAHGRVRLKVEVATQGVLAGKEINNVAFFHRPKQLYSPTQSSRIELPKVGPTPPPENEPDDIPF